MPIENLNWRPSSLEVLNIRRNYLGFDIHVLRNNSPTLDLRDHIWGYLGSSVYKTLSDLKANPGLAGYSSVEIDFTTNLNGSQVSIAGQTLTVSNYGVTMGTKTGIVTATSLSGNGIDYKKNFNFDVTATVTTVPANQVGSTPLTTTFRVHIHESIQSAWMTPSIMDAVVGEPDHIFAIYAQFSDDTVGDITFHPGINWATSSSGITLEKANPSSNAASNFTGKFTPTTTGTKTITATAPAAFNSIAIASGQVKAVTWLAPDISVTPPKLEYIKGGPGNTLFASYRNVLIVSEGFVSNDKANFVALATDIRSEMKIKTSKRPWDLLVPNINFWTLFIPSPEAECTIRDEQIPFKSISKIGPIGGPYTEPEEDLTISLEEFVTYGDKFMKKLDKTLFKELQIDDNTKPTTDPARYLSERSNALTTPELLLSELIKKVGLATPKDADVTVTIANLRAKWSDLYDPSITTYDVTPNSPTNVPKELWKLWLKTGERRLLNHRNTFFKFEFGKPPRTDAAAETGRTLGTGYQRFKRANIDNLITNLDDGVSANIGQVWSTPSNPPSFPKDFDLVLFLVRGPRYGGTRQENINDNSKSDIITTSINIKERYIGTTGNNTNMQLDITPEQLVPSTIPIERLYVITHELAHAFLLGDEYGRKEGKYNLANPFFNLNKLSEVQTTVQNVTKLDADKIKWRWLRYEAAGVVTAITPNNAQSGLNNGNGIFLTLKGATHLAGFAMNDKVRLRKKALSLVNTSNQVPPLVYSIELTIKDINTNDNKILVDGLNADPGFFGAYYLVKLVSAEVAGMGTIGITNATVNGQGTYFTLQVDKLNFGNGAIIKIGNTPYAVQSVDSDTQITLTQSITPPVTPGKNYNIIPKEKYSELLNNTIRLAISKFDTPMTKIPYTLALNEVGTEEQSPEITQLTWDGSGNPAMSIYNQVVGVSPESVVGLFAGGQEFESGELFHPTGYCNMRKSKDGTSRFCPVCRYIMVDKIDPSMHGNINFDYEIYNNPNI